MNTPTATIGIRGTIFIAEYICASQGDLASYAAASVAVVGRPYANGLPVTDMPLPGAPLAVQSARGVESTPVAQAQAPAGSGRPSGLYVQVLDGVISLSNPGGSTNFSSGQFGFSGSLTLPPVIVPNNPGIQFTPPPVFSSSTGPQPRNGNTPPGSNDVDCEVR